MLYELTTLSSHPLQTLDVCVGLEAYLENNCHGQLLGCWMTDIGPLGQIIILRSYDSSEELEEARKQQLLSANPFGVGHLLTDWQQETYAGFPYLPKVELGRFGPVYEFRTYWLKPGGLQPTMDAWEQALPERTKLSSLTLNMYALDGSPRITHIWPYESLDARSAIRLESYMKGIWPPQNAPQQFMKATSLIATPVAFSPLQ